MNNKVTSTRNNHLHPLAGYTVLILALILATPAAGSLGDQFIDDDKRLELLDGGPGWTWLRLYDEHHPGDIALANDALIIRASHLDTAPLPEYLKEDFRRDYRERSINYRTSDELIFTSREALRQVEELEPWWCEPYWTTSTFEVSETGSHQFGSDWLKEFEDGALSGSLKVEPPSVSLELSGSASFRIRRWCGAPVFGVFDRMSLDASIEVATAAEMKLQVDRALEKEKEWLIERIRLGGTTFFVGPVFIYLNFSIPLNAGLSIEAEASLNYTVSSSISVEGVLGYTCTRESCSANPELNMEFVPPEPMLTLEGQATGRAWVRPGIRVALYNDAFVYAEASGRVYLKGDLWGYYGNSCGDADGDGSNEWVGGVTTDLSFGVDVLFTLSGLGNNSTWTAYEWNQPLAFYAFDFANSSSPLEPIIEAENPAARNGQLRVGEVGEWRVAMRPCYPYSDDITFQVTPEVNGAEEHTVPPDEGLLAELAFETPGSYQYRFTAVQDDQNRSLGKSRELDIEVVPSRPPRDG